MDPHSKTTSIATSHYTPEKFLKPPYADTKKAFLTALHSETAIAVASNMEKILLLQYYGKVVYGTQSLLCAFDCTEQLL